MTSHKPSSNFLRWTLAIMDGLFFAWFLTVGYLAARLLLRMSESQIELEREPLFTQYTRILLPEFAWSLLPGALCFGFGFGFISLNADESPTSRIFRWAVILSATLFYAAAIPAIDAHLLLNEGPEDVYLFDEVLYLFLGLTMFIYGFFQFRRHDQDRCA